MQWSVFARLPLVFSASHWYFARAAEQIFSRDADAIKTGRKLRASKSVSDNIAEHMNNNCGWCRSNSISHMFFAQKRPNHLVLCTRFIVYSRLFVWSSLYRASNCDQLNRGRGLLIHTIHIFDLDFGGKAVVAFANRPRQCRHLFWFALCTSYMDNRASDCKWPQKSRCSFHSGSSQRLRLYRARASNQHWHVLADQVQTFQMYSVPPWQWVSANSNKEITNSGCVAALLSAIYRVQ